MPKAFSEPEKETLRAQFRAKGKRLFEKHGLKKTSVDELTEAVVVSKGAFYLFYDSKEELFLEILEEIEREIQASILEFTIQPKSGSRQKLSQMLKGFLLTWDDYPLLKNLSQSDMDYLLRKIPPERALKHAHNDAEFTKAFIKKAKREGVAIKTSPSVVSNLMKSLFFVGLHREELGKEGYAEVLEVLTDLVAGYVVGGKP